MNSEVLNLDEFLNEDEQKSQIISFPYGIVGFEECENFALYRIKNERFKGLVALESMDIKNLRFIAIPVNIITMKELKLLKDEDMQELIDVTGTKERDFLFLYLVTIQDSQLFFNQRAPIVIDASNKHGMQIILDVSYPLSVDIRTLTNVNLGK